MSDDESSKRLELRVDELQGSTSPTNLVLPSSSLTFGVGQIELNPTELREAGKHIYAVGVLGHHIKVFGAVGKTPKDISEKYRMRDEGYNPIGGGRFSLMGKVLWLDKLVASDDGVPQWAAQQIGKIISSEMYRQAEIKVHDIRILSGSGHQGFWDNYVHQP